MHKQISEYLDLILRQRFSIKAIFIVGLMAAFAPCSFGSSIVWEAPEDSADKSQLIEGEVVLALNGGPGNISVSGGGASGASSYSFTSVSYQDISFVPSPGYRKTADVSNGAPSTGDTDFDSLLKSSTDANNSIASGTQTLSNLVVGERYRIQIFYNDQRFNRVMTFSDDAASPNFEDLLSEGSDWGQFVVGSFVASGTTQALNHIANGFANVHFNAILVVKNRDYYVSTTGDDTAAGTLLAPFATIQKAADVMNPGDTCYVRGGTYYETVTMSNKFGSSAAPLTFTNYNGESVKLDGTQALSEIGSSGWTLHSGSIYKTTLNSDIWQLFDDGELMMRARWPNARLDDGTAWDWASWSEAGGSNGTVVDLGNGGLTLAGSGIDATGAIAVLTVGTWKSWAREVISHTAGASTFTHGTVPLYRTSHRYYMLESKLELLDAEGEWFFDTASKTLYLWAPGGSVPSGDIRGKTKDLAFEVSSSSHVVLDGFEFFGVAVDFSNVPYTTIQNCDFLYSSSYKRMLGITDAPVRTSVQQLSKTTPSYSVFRNCAFKYIEGEAIVMKGLGDLIENCLFEYIDWNPAELIGLQGGISISGDDNVFRRNTLRYCGASQALQIGGARLLAEYNDLSNYGLLQSDGGGLHMTIPTQTDCELRYNWIYDSDENGIRFDALIPPDPNNLGMNGLVHHNVAWDVRTVGMIKGMDHNVFNNMGFDNSANDIIILNTIPEWDGTITRNNAGYISGSRNNQAAIPGPDAYNWNLYVEGGSLQSQLRDVSQQDFRPIAGSGLIDAGAVEIGITDGYIGTAPDIGAYESGDSNYWIPGRQSAASSRPIPNDGALGQASDRDLIWLGGYGGVSYDVYFGASYNAVATATPGSSEFQGNQTNNIFMPNYSAGASTWYWRVDTITPNGTVEGPVWSFASSTTSSTFMPSDDAWVFDGNAANYGSTPSIRVRGYQTAGSRFSLLKFDLSSLGATPIVSAKLRLRTLANPISDVTVRSVTDNSWSETTVTGTNEPAIIAAEASETNLSPATWYEFDLSHYITSGGIWSMALTTTQNTQALDFSSKEGAYPPELVVEY